MRKLNNIYLNPIILLFLSRLHVSRIILPIHTQKFICHTNKKHISLQYTPCDVFFTVYCSI